MVRFLILVTGILSVLAFCSCSSSSGHSVREFHGAIADPYVDGRAKVTNRKIPVVESGLLPGGRRYIGFSINRTRDQFWSTQHQWGGTTLLLTGDLSTGAPIKITPGNPRVRAWFVSRIPLRSKLFTTAAPEEQWMPQLKASWAAADSGTLSSLHPEAKAVPLYGTIRIDRFALPEFSTLVSLSSDRSPNPSSKALITGSLASRGLTANEKAALGALGVLGVILAIGGALGDGSISWDAPPGA